VRPQPRHTVYYANKARPPSARACRDAVIGPALRQLWEDNYRVYGARKLWKTARRAGHDVGRDQVARLMRTAGIEGVRRGKRLRTTKPDPVSAELLDHVLGLDFQRRGSVLPVRRRPSVELPRHACATRRRRSSTGIWYLRRDAGAEAGSQLLENSARGPAIEAMVRSVRHAKEAAMRQGTQLSPARERPSMVARREARVARRPLPS
jgi:hypothetical protein